MKNLAKTIGSPIRTMPQQVIKHIINHSIINPSPYNRSDSGSYYNTPDKDWDFTPDGTIRLSDHWNFISPGSRHCITSTPVENYKWVVAKYNAATGTYYVIDVFEKNWNNKFNKQQHIDPLLTNIFERFKAKKIAKYYADVKVFEAKKEAFLESFEAKILKVRLALSIEAKMNKVIHTLPRSGYKMGDLFTLTVGEHVVRYDSREYYSGRGSKYNSSVRHGDIRKTISKAELERVFTENFLARLQKEKFYKSPEFLKALKKFNAENVCPEYPVFNFKNHSNNSDDDSDDDYYSDEYDY